MAEQRITPSNDIELAICTGASRKSVKWTNKTTTWGKLLNRCARTQRTDETLAQYLQMSKDEQGTIKDKGGFVGGSLTQNGHRKKDNVFCRQVITLDADSVKPERNIWDDFKREFSFAACIYSTHKHTPEAPRLRIIIPLSESVDLEKWEAVSRHIAGRLGIEQFDPTTFQASRLMYWPTTPKDGEFVFSWQDGEILQAEEILNKYDNWQDISQWPYHPKEAPEAILNNRRKAPDPTEKNGIVGAFCKVYTVKDAIDTFLSDVYEPTTQANRYTFKRGSTFGGLVVYADGYAFSNHATDPAHFNGHGCNAFDLVRIHLFGAEDADSDEATPMNRRPSFLKMDAFAREDAEVKKHLIAQMQQTGKEIFDGVNLEDIDDADKDEPDGTADGDEWKGKLTFNKHLKVERTPLNIRAILLNDPELKKVRFDLFRGRDVSFSKAFETAKGAYINDESAGKISLYLYEKWNLDVSVNKVFEYLQTTAKERAFNPVEDFINSQTWDGKPRIETALIDYLGAADTPLNRAVTRKWFVGAVARIFNPGVKFDYVLTIPGPQGIGKSTFFRTIAGPGGKWFSDSFSFALSDKAKYEVCNSAWIIEISELAGLKKTEAEEAKRFLTKQADTYRAAYAHTADDYPRHCIFAATTNEEFFLTGDNGNRRWWIVKAEGRQRDPQRLKQLTVAAPQMWAEAKHYFDQSEQLYLSEELEAQAEAVQFEYNRAGGDDLLPVVEAFLNELLPTDWEGYTKDQRASYFKFPDGLQAAAAMKRETVSAEVIRNELPDERIKGYSAQRINALLERCKGWKLTAKAKTTPGQCYPRTRKVFERINEPTEPPEDDI